MKIPLPVIGRKNVVQVHVDTAQEGASAANKRDDLQAVIAMLRGADLDVVVQFVTYG
jgi:uncharacterized protein YajQ (UPF0234 family)